MSRIARSQRVFFFEEPVWEEAEPRLRLQRCSKSGVCVVTPVLPRAFASESASIQSELLEELVREQNVRQHVAWYYTPMALEFSGGLRPQVVVYDCMDELSAFAAAPALLCQNEQLLFECADLVFAGGASLYEAKRYRHAAVHLFPSSVDYEHFAAARGAKRDPVDQAAIPSPRLGYAGVIDERMDLDLLREVARRRADWQLVLLGPHAKIDSASLPRAGNIHYLGLKRYEDLPAYLSGWQIGLLPFALNESTRFISPTKTPEYLAAGLRVVSTPIRDVVTPYGALGLASIANGPDEFIAACAGLLEQTEDHRFQADADRLLARFSWDRTAREMCRLIQAAWDVKQQEETGAQVLAGDDRADKANLAHV
jgi:glycosyltransferase involved in cell wall biosynthesis